MIQNLNFYLGVDSFVREHVNMREEAAAINMPVFTKAANYNWLQ